MPEVSRTGRRRQTPGQIAKARRSHMLWLGLLVLLVYASSLVGGFIWTDRDDLLQGAYRLTSTADLGSALSSSREAYRARVTGGSADPSAGSWQPLAVLSNTLGWSLWGECAFCFHLENLVLHGLLVIGLYALGRHVLARRRQGNSIAFWSAAVFAAHPATVSTVAGIGGQPRLLGAAFAAWTLVIFTRLQATTNARHVEGRPWLLRLGLVGLAAMLSDEIAYMLPLLALLIAVYESRERDRPMLRGIAPQRLQGLALLSAVLLCVLGYRLLVLGGLQFAADYPSASAVNNLGSALRLLWFHIDQVLLPAEPIVSDAWPVTQAWGAVETAALLGLLLLLGVTLIGLRMPHPSAFGVAWFLLCLVPGVGVFPTSHYHDSQTLYLAAWGAAFAATYGIFLLWRPVGRQLIPGSEAVIYVPIILVLGIITGLSNARWWDHVGLFESEIAIDPHYMEGRLELAKAAMAEKDAAAAMNHVLAAIESSRDQTFTGYWSSREAYILLGRAQWELGMYSDAAESIRGILEAQPNDAHALYWLGVTQLSLGDFIAAESSFRSALRLRPALPEAEGDLGVALVGQQRFVEAYPLLAAALDRSLGSPRLYRALALTMIEANRLEEAARYLELALAGREDADERARLAWVSWRLGRVEKARSDLDMALQFEEQTGAYVSWVSDQLARTEPGSSPPADAGDAARPR
ncbi:MAG: tetratricopeptide repeat protein [Chromatiaceae bacterium]|nr:tetratricopeptide repeat protein [Chromatiaceae bacterium]